MRDDTQDRAGARHPNGAASAAGEAGRDGTEPGLVAEALVAYFGYGSLVNRATLRTGIVAGHRARLKGWRRSWRPRPAQGPGHGVGPGDGVADAVTPAFLSAARSEDAAIDGLLIIDYARNLTAVDAREFHYHRRPISLDDLDLDDRSAISGAMDRQGPGGEVSLFVYEGRTDLPPASGPSPILRSYLDAVMQGFLREFGESGLHRFVRETDAFHIPIHEDRDAPLYPRSVILSAKEVDLFDTVLASGSGPSDN